MAMQQADVTVHGPSGIRWYGSLLDMFYSNDQRVTRPVIARVRVTDAGNTYLRLDTLLDVPAQFVTLDN